MPDAEEQNWTWLLERLVVDPFVPPPPDPDTVPFPRAKRIESVQRKEERERKRRDQKSLKEKKRRGGAYRICLRNSGL
jgi:hypothetical protein